MDTTTQFREKTKMAEGITISIDYGTAVYITHDNCNFRTSPLTRASLGEVADIVRKYASENEDAGDAELFMDNDECNALGKAVSKGNGRTVSLNLLNGKAVVGIRKEGGGNFENHCMGLQGVVSFMEGCSS